MIIMIIFLKLFKVALYAILILAIVCIFLLQVKTLEFIRLAPKGSLRVQSFLEKAAEGLVEGGRLVSCLSN